MEDKFLTKDDKYFLFRTIELAKKGKFTTSPNPNVGCVIVYNNKIIGEGYHKKAGGPHAEIVALSEAGSRANGSTAYITIEPCAHYGKTPPCVDALIKAKISKVVFAMTDPNPKVSGLGFRKLKESGVKVLRDAMPIEAKKINEGFIKRMKKGIPWVRLKLAMSLDGHTAMSSGESKWITSYESRKDVQVWRAESCLILSTSTTILMDNPSMTVRWKHLPENIKNIYPADQLRQPVRVIIDSKNRITPNLKIMKKRGEVWLARTTYDSNIWPNFVKQILIPLDKKNKNSFINFRILLNQIGSYNINTILVEAGATLSGMLLHEKLVDELLLYQSPKLLGSNTRPLCIIPIDKIDDALNFKFIESKLIGEDMFFRLRPK